VNGNGVIVNGNGNNVNGIGEDKKDNTSVVSELSEASLGNINEDDEG
jgi:hypothetical protein